MSTAADFLTVAIQCLQVRIYQFFLLVCRLTPWNLGLQGLAYMHRQRIAHLDVYPSNILANHVVHHPATPFFRAFDFRLAYIDFGFSAYISGGTPLIDVQRLPPTYNDLPEVKSRRRHIDPFAADVSGVKVTKSLPHRH